MTGLDRSHASPTQGSLLILDDDELVGLLLENVGRLSGLATQRVLDHESFFKALQTMSPSHVVIDLNLAAMPGEEVLRRLAAVGCKARVVICSGDTTGRLTAASSLATDLGLNCAGALHKPFTLSSVRRLLTMP